MLQCLYTHLQVLTEKRVFKLYSYTLNQNLINKDSVTFLNYLYMIKILKYYTIFDYI